MGNLWSEDDFTELEADIPEEEKQESELTLYGKLYSKPNVNFQAFLSTMRKAWKLESIKCELIEPGFFYFIFSSVEDKREC